MELRYGASRRVEADPILFAGNRERDVSKLLHGLRIVPVDLVLGFPRSFVGVLEQNTSRTSHDLQDMLFGVPALDSLPRVNVTPVVILDGCEPRYEEDERYRNDKTGNSKRALHDLTMIRRKFVIKGEHLFA